MDQRNQAPHTQYGVCQNKECEKFQEPQPMRRGNTLCEKCKKPLAPCRPPKSKKKGPDSKLLVIIGAAVLVAIVIAMIFVFGGSKEEVPEPVVNGEQTDSVANNTPAVENRNDTLVIKVEGMEGAPADTLKEAVKELPDETAEEPIIEAEEEVVEEHVVKEVKVAAPTHQTPASKPTATAKTASSSKSLGYGTWTGGMKNGQPHGMGTMTYSSSHVIDSRDSKGRKAQAGEYIVGEWDNGHLVQGRWFKKDGTKEAIIIGKAG